MGIRVQGLETWYCVNLRDQASQGLQDEIQSCWCAQSGLSSADV